MSYSKGSKGGSQSNARGYVPNQARGKGKASGKSQTSGYEPQDSRIDGDKTYRKYLNAANPLGAIL